MNEFLKRVPIPAAGLALGLVSLGNLLRPVSTIITWIAAACSFILIALLIAKMLFHPRLVKSELQNPTILSVSGTFFMAIMQLASLASQTTIAFIIWCAAIVGHLALIALLSLRMLRSFQWDDIFPTYFITYVGIIVATATASAFDMQVVGQGLFWMGFVCYIVLLAAVTYRVATIPLPESAQPLICIYAAPMSLSLTGYLSCFADPNPLFVLCLAVLAQALLVFAVIRIPNLIASLHGRFFPSIAAMTFPFVISATGLGKTCLFFAAQDHALPDAIGGLSAAETVLATIMVLYAAFRYLGYFRQVMAEGSAVAEPSPELHSA